jgi:hypothetical protein
MAVNSQYRTAYDRYISLLQQGVPAMEAYRQAFPQGIETGQKTPEQEAKEKAKEQQRLGIAQIGGALTGALGTKAVFDVMEGKPVLGGLRETTGILPPSGGTPTPVATPQVTSITRGPALELPAGSTTTPNGDILAPDGTVKDAATGASIGNWVQGALGAIQVYQGVQQYKEGEKLEGALGAGTGALNVGAALGSQTAAAYVPYANIAMGGYQLGKMALDSGDYTKSQAGQLGLQGGLAGAQLGAGIGSFLPGVGTAIGAGIGAALGGAYGLVSGLSGSGKGMRQMVRDKWRDAIQEQGIQLFDDKYQGKLPDGSTFDWGKDKFAFGKGEGQIDLENPVVGKAAAYGNVLAALQGATDRKPREAIATQFLAAGTQNAANDMDKMKSNFQYFFNTLGMNPKDAQTQLDTMFKEGKLDEDKYKIFSNDLKEMLG